QIFGAFICYINDRFDAMQPQFTKRKSQDSRHCFSHYSLPPESAIEFIACFCAIKANVEMKETARADQSFFSLTRNTPTQSHFTGVSFFYLPDHIFGFMERLMRLMPIEFHAFFIRKYGKQCLCIM